MSRSIPLGDVCLEVRADRLTTDADWPVDRFQRFADAICDAVGKHEVACPHVGVNENGVIVCADEQADRGRIMRAFSAFGVPVTSIGLRYD